MEIIGHRGAPREHTENTLESFARAIELGADGVELDVHLSADGQVVVHHDPAVRTRDDAVRVAIADTALAELRKVSRVPLPTLEDVLDLVAPRAVAYVEIKGVGALERVVALCAAWPGRTAVHSFDHRAPREAARRLASLPVGILEVSRVVDPSAALRTSGARDLWQHWELLDEELVRQVHATGGRIVAWTVNDIAVAHRFRDWGVDALCTDLPGEMARSTGGAR